MYSPCRYKFGRYAGDTRIIFKMAKMPFVPEPGAVHFGYGNGGPWISAHRTAWINWIWAG